MINALFAQLAYFQDPLRSCLCRSAAYFYQGCAFCNVFRTAVRQARTVLIRCEMKRLFADSCVHRGRLGDWIPMFEMRRHIRKQRRADGDMRTVERQETPGYRLS